MDLPAHQEKGLVSALSPSITVADFLVSFLERSKEQAELKQFLQIILLMKHINRNYSKNEWAIENDLIKMLRVNTLTHEEGVLTSHKVTITESLTRPFWVSFLLLLYKVRMVLVIRSQSSGNDC